MNAEDIASPSKSQNQQLPKDGAPESPATAANQSRDGTTGVPDYPKPAAPRCAEGTLQLAIHDHHGDPIANLKFKVFVEKKEFYSGQTDARGVAPAIEGFKIGSVFEIRVRRDGGDYKFAAIGKIESEENIACLKSPKTRFEFNTVAHQGAPGGAEAHKAETTSRHNQKPAEVPNLSGNPDKQPVAKQDRNAKGHPKAVVAHGRTNICGTNSKGGESPNANKSEMEKVKALIDFATEQASRIHPDGLTAQAIIEQMQGGCDQKAGNKTAFGYQNSIKRCAKYVKIALWWAGYSHNNGDITNGVGLAKDMGPSLLAAGFRDVTAHVPDARWAAPGDIIVYRRIGEPNAAGHVDIRTYDGYISDFVETYLPVRKLEVTGIYRKYSDPEPVKRMRAFLKVLREWECHEEPDDAKRYYLMQKPINGSRIFVDTTKHPYVGLGAFQNTPAGAYQIVLGTYKELAGPLYRIGAGFGPLSQDRMAIANMERKKKSPLALVRRGEIERAVGALTPDTWSSLPGGKHPRREVRNGRQYEFTMGDLLNRYNTFLSEQKGQ